MLYIVLVLVLAALGLLVAALITANSLWAWISIGLSVLAGLLLVFDWLRRRGKREAEEKAAADGEVAEETPEAEEGEAKKREDAEQTVLLPATGELGDAVDAGKGADTNDASAASSETQDASGASPETEVPNGDPGEEKSDAADVQIVSELETEIVVVDEYPRYHLTDCEWLAGRDTIPLGIGEARQLGFTPCALCTPDATIAERHRDKTKADS